MLTATAPMIDPVPAVSLTEGGEHPEPGGAAHRAVVRPAVSAHPRHVLEVARAVAAPPFCTAVLTTAVLGPEVRAAAHPGRSVMPGPARPAGPGVAQRDHRRLDRGHGVLTLRIHVCNLTTVVI